MTARVLDGVPLADAIRAEVAEAVKRHAGGGRKPGLAVVIVGENPASQVYVKAKGKTMLEIRSTGPFEITYVNTADDPRKAPIQ